MALREGRRTVERTRMRVANGLVLRRAGLGASLVALGLAPALHFGGWAWALAALLGIPGVTTLAAARHRFVAPCPGCGAELGGAVFVGPDEPVIARGALDHRCASCGIYVDVVRGDVQEVPFGREATLAGYSLTLDANSLDAIEWGARCVTCGAPSSAGLDLAAHGAGLLLDERSAATPGGRVPFCDEHGAAGARRGVVVARAGAKVTVELSSYAAYRALLDANRARVDVALRALPRAGEG